ncbi:Integral membrane protein SED5 [Friedmanniomyces endolithicus]|nr:Integral membrane protein SED5 [Friedmanniomyces endolithicus]
MRAGLVYYTGRGDVKVLMSLFISLTVVTHTFSSIITLKSPNPSLSSSLAIFGRHFRATSTRVGPLSLLRGGWVWKLLQVDLYTWRRHGTATSNDQPTPCGPPGHLSYQVSVHPPVPTVSSSAESRQTAHHYSGGHIEASNPQQRQAVFRPSATPRMLTTVMSHTTTIQDRTPEFRSILTQAQKSLARQRKPLGGSTPQHSQPLLPSSQNGSATPPTRKQRSEFARNAAGIGRGISATMGKLQRLAELAKRKTLFDDRPVEIAELTYVIKQDLAGLNQQIGALQQLQRRSGTAGSAAGKDGAGSSREEGEHNKNVVLLLQGKLADVGANFKDVLEVRTKNIQASRSRQDNFVSAVSQQSQQQPNGHLDAAARRTDSPLYSTTATNTPSRGRSPKPGPIPNAATQDLLSLDPSSTALYHSSNPATQQYQLQLLEEGSQAPNTYTTQRGEAIEAIERTIADLGGIFGQLAQMVSEQSEQIQRIDANTDDVVDNVEGAQRELMKYWARVQGNRWLVAKMMGVLMVFFLVWVLVAG